MKELLLLTEKGRCYRCQRATVEQYGLRLLSKTFIQVRQENKIYKILFLSTSISTTEKLSPRRSAVFDWFTDDYHHWFADENVSAINYCTILAYSILHDLYES
ncbi:uncharacterized protein LOC112600865 [Melanaphis sacchari]|uniref:uncharacterized protein LOC112600865 n=1 Tax=Melanaphis sacchari TaxID=742174 RepID=UPI000DC13021|nr:uncharacterized protein LOC112600865 [Melanaphis sacchari]